MVWNNNNGSGGAGSLLDRPRTADELPRFARDTTPENPWPVSLLSQHFHDAVERWPAAWIEGQIIEINARRTGTVYLTLRDSFQEVSISALGFGAFAQKARAFQQGDRIRLAVDSDRTATVLPALATLGISDLRVAPPSLEELFLRHYGDDLATLEAAEDRADDSTPPTRRARRHQSERA